MVLHAPGPYGFIGATRGACRRGAPHPRRPCLSGREIEVVTELPKTNTGKIQRFLLRGQEAAAAAKANTHTMTTRYEAVTPGRWSDRLTFSPAIRVGNLPFISGTTATDESLQIVGLGDICAQTRQIFRKWEPILKAVGASFDNIVETTDYYTTLEGYAGTAAVRREFFRHPFPPRPACRWRGLSARRHWIEIKGIAVLDAARLRRVLGQVLVSGITAGAVYALVALGFVVLHRGTRVVHFGLGDQLTLSAYAVVVEQVFLGCRSGLRFSSPLALSAGFGVR